jgi:hypothetical protein
MASKKGPTMLVSKAVVAAEGLCIDTNTKLSSSEGQALWDAGVRYIIRYVPLPGNSAGGDLDVGELTRLTAIGHTVIPIQHPRSPQYNTLNATTGLADAQHAINYCLSIDIDPSKVSVANGGRPPALGLDMEGLKNPGPDSFAHAKVWVTTVLAAGFSALVYFGYDSGVTSAQADELTALGAFVIFWCDAGPYNQRPAPSQRYTLKQHMQQSVLAGVNVDKDDILQDNVLYGIAFAPDPTPDPDATIQPA